VKTFLDAMISLLSVVRLSIVGIKQAHRLDRDAAADDRVPHPS
jgi:hypothetical protein